MRASKMVSVVILISAAAMFTTGCRLPWMKPKPSTTLNTTGNKFTIPDDQSGSLAGRPGFAGLNPATGQVDPVLFAYDSAQIEATEQAKIQAVADYMKANPQVKVSIEGNCDERGSAEYNLSLGERRALAARAFLVSQGVDASRVETKSFGKEIPKDPGHTEDSWRANRRDEFKLLQ